MKSPELNQSGIVEEEIDGISGERPESAKELIISEGIENWIISDKFKFLDAGADGVVFELDLNDLAPRAVQAMDLDNGDKEHVTKIIKLYSLGKAQHEVGLQLEAVSLLADLDENTQELVAVPGGAKAFDIEIQNQEARGKLKDNSITILKDGKIGMIIMDKVKGKTMLVWACHQLLRNRSKDFAKLKPGIDIEQFIADNQTESSLRSTMHQLIGRDISNISNNKEFIDYISGELSISGNQLIGQDNADALERTMVHFNDQGFFHRDFHLKNIMIDDQGVFHVIDFGKSIKVDTRYTDIKDPQVLREEVYRGNILRDKDIVNMVKKLSTKK